MADRRQNTPCRTAEPFSRVCAKYKTSITQVQSNSIYVKVHILVVHLAFGLFKTNNYVFNHFVRPLPLWRFAFRYFGSVFFTNCSWSLFRRHLDLMLLVCLRMHYSTLLAWKSQTKLCIRWHFTWTRVSGTRVYMSEFCKLSTRQTGLETIIMKTLAEVWLEKGQPLIVNWPGLASNQGSCKQCLSHCKTLRLCRPVAKRPAVTCVS